MNISEYDNEDIRKYHWSERVVIANDRIKRALAVVPVPSGGYKNFKQLYKALKKVESNINERTLRKRLIPPANLRRANLDSADYDKDALARMGPFSAYQAKHDFASAYNDEIYRMVAALIPKDKLENIGREAEHINEVIFDALKKLPAGKKFSMSELGRALYKINPAMLAPTTVFDKIRKGKTFDKTVYNALKPYLHGMGGGELRGVATNDMILEAAKQLPDGKKFSMDGLGKALHGIDSKIVAKTVAAKISKGKGFDETIYGALSGFLSDLPRYVMSGRARINRTDAYILEAAKQLPAGKNFSVKGLGDALHKINPMVSAVTVSKKMAKGRQFDQTIFDALSGFLKDNSKALLLGAASGKVAALQKHSERAGGIGNVVLIASSVRKK